MRGRSRPQKLTFTWLKFYGLHQFHMALDDVMLTTPGEMIDLINCLAIFKGAAREKKRMTFDQIMMLR